MSGNFFTENSDKDYDKAAQHIKTLQPETIPIFLTFRETILNLFSYTRTIILSCIIFAITMNSIVMINGPYSDQIKSIIGANNYIGILSFLLAGMFLGSYVVFWQRLFIFGNEQNHTLTLYQWLKKSGKVFFYFIITMLLLAIGRAFINTIMLAFKDILEQSSYNTIITTYAFVALISVAIVCFIFSTLSLRLTRISIGNQPLNNVSPYDFAKTGRLQLAIVLFYISLMFILVIGFFSFSLNFLTSNFELLASYKNEIFNFLGLFIIGFFIILFISAHSIAYIKRKAYLLSELTG